MIRNKIKKNLIINHQTKRINLLPQLSILSSLSHHRNSMKKDILHSGKLYQLQRSHQYQLHLSKITQITQTKRPSTLSLKQDKFLPTYPSGYKLEQQLKVRQENHRLVKKLQEINRRKRFEVLASEEGFSSQVDKYSELHKKYSEIGRQKRERELQEENQRIVEKLVGSRQKQKIREEYTREEGDFFMLRMSRSRKKQRNNKKINHSNSGGSQEKARINRNHSLLDQKHAKITLIKNIHNNTTNQRKRNYSTLLPTIDKLYQQPQAAVNINNTDIMSALQRHQKEEQNCDKAKVVNMAVELNLENKENVVNSLDQYEAIFEEEVGDVKGGDFEVDGKDGNAKEEKVVLQSKDARENPEQLNDPSNSKGQTHLASSLIDVKQDPMSPTLKFEKLKKSKAKKRQPIEKVKEENSYEDQQFQVDLVAQ